MRLMTSDELTKLDLTELGAKEDAFRFTIMIMTTIEISKKTDSWLMYQFSSPFRVIHASVKLMSAKMRADSMPIDPSPNFPNPVQNAIELCRILLGSHNDGTQVALHRHYNIVALPYPPPYTLLL
jgi:hypothetical protein